MTRPVVIICVEDLKKVVPHFEPGYLVSHKSEMRALLHNLGFDTDFAIEYQEQLLCRTKLSGVVVTDRIVGTERTDTAWKQSGNASEAAREYSEDVSMVTHLSKMKRGKKETNKKEETE